jgi:hypothetical protein
MISEDGLRDKTEAQKKKEKKRAIIALSTTLRAKAL